MPSAVLTVSSPGAGPSSPPKTFKRFRSSLEQTLRSATGAKPKPKPSLDILQEQSSSNSPRRKHPAPDPAAVNPAPAPTDKGKHHPPVVSVDENDKKERSMLYSAGFGLKRLESKVGLKRLASRDHGLSYLPEPPLTPVKDRDKHKSKVTAKPSAFQSSDGMSFITPSLSLATLSSPALHQASVALPSPRSTPAEPVSRDTSAHLVSPPRPRKIVIPASGKQTGHELSHDPRDRPPSRSRTALTSPSTPTLTKSPPLHSASPTPTSARQAAVPGSHAPTTPPRLRPRPAPLRSASASTSHLPLTSSPTTPTTSAALHGTTSSGTTLSSSPSSSPSSLRPRARSPTLPHMQSRPPLSPSAASTAGLKLKMRTAASASASHLPLDTTTSGMERPDKSMYRRPSGGASTGRPTPPSSPAASPTAHRVQLPARASPPPPPSPSPQHRRPRGTTSSTPLTLSGTGSSPTSGLGYAHPPHSPSRAHSSLQNQQQQSPSRLHQRPRNTSPLPTSASASASSPSPTSALSSHRDILRHAASLLIRELGGPRPRSPAGSAATDIWDECELRLRALMRAERIWGRAGPAANASSLSVHSISGNAGTSGSGLSQSGEDRERRVFAEAMRDGYVLCQLINKLRPGTITRVDAREDGFVHTSNVTKCLAAATTLGVPASELFMRDDLIECTPHALHRVARTVIALLRLVGDAPAPPASKYLHGLGLGHPSGSPYGTRSKASASTPNLSLSTLQQRPTSPMLTKHRRWSPPSPTLPTVRSNSPAEDSHSNGKSGSASGKESSKTERTARTKVKAIPIPQESQDSALATDDSEVSDGNEQYYDLGPVPEIGSMHPPKSPRRSHAATANTTTNSSRSGARASVASGSSQATDGTTFSSLLAPGSGAGTAGERSTKFGTIRTVTTEATSFAPSDVPSFTRTEASSVAASLSHTGPAVHSDESTQRQRSLDLPGPRRGDAGYIGYNNTNGGAPVFKVAFPVRERKPSETAAVDLSRVAEETEEPSVSNASGNHLARDDVIAGGKKKLPAIQLGKGKWPDDFMSAFSAPSPSQPIIKQRKDGEQFARSASPISLSPLRNLSVVGLAKPNESAESLSQLPPRRPTHRPRHSIDAPGLLPKEAVLGREHTPSPDGLAPNPRVMLRRNSRTGAHRNGIYIPRNDSESPSPDSNARIPFPRSVSADHTGPSPLDPLSTGLPSKFIHRGRFQSEIDGGTRRKPRPSSYDELGAKPGRSRIESMVNLGGGSSNASASDLMMRDSMDGTSIRQTLIVREEGKPPTHFQLGNCIGRGQFGSVYRALNLNTGQMVAVKRIRLEGLSEEDIKQLMREVDLVKRLSHPSIVKYEGMVRDSDTLNIILEYAENGSLGQTLKAFGKLNEKLVASYVIKILEGLDYLHRSDVVHCDLKAANILTTKNGNVKLSDFGVSLNLRQMEREIKNDVAGTPNWMAPEVIELKGASTASDIWSLGCTVIELLTGRPPYADIANGMSVMFRIVEDDIPPIPDDCSDSLKDFLKVCFSKDPNQRPSAEWLCEHEWLTKNGGIHKELRPQDSIPFLRRVSVELQRSEGGRFPAGIDIPRADSQASDRPRRSEDNSGSPILLGLAGSPPRKRLSSGLSSPRIPESEVSVPREHSFVKTIFSKSVICRVCMQSVKKSAVLCEDCSLIAHSRCAPNAPPTCDLRAQLLQYAQYSQNGSPISPLEIIAAHHQFSPPTSPIGDSPTPDTPLPPPTAFKMFGAFKRSRSSLSPEPGRSQGTSQNSSREDVPMPPPRTRKPSVLRRSRESHVRPTSLASTDTTPNRSSLRSAATAGESVSSQNEAVKSVLSATDTDAPYTNSRFSVADTDGRRASTFAPSSVGGDYESNGVPGELSTDDKRSSKKRDSKGSSNNGCSVQ